MEVSMAMAAEVVAATAVAEVAGAELTTALELEPLEPELEESPPRVKSTQDS
jgi:hypothetical protein